jgi:hypothetical protein
MAVRKIKKGESIYDLAARTGESVGKLYRYFGTSNPRKGTRYNTRRIAEMKTGTGRAWAIAQDAPLSGVPGGATYSDIQAQRGDSFATIAEKAGIDTQDLLEANANVLQVHPGGVFGRPPVTPLELSRRDGGVPVIEPPTLPGGRLADPEFMRKNIPPPPRASTPDLPSDIMSFLTPSPAPPTEAVRPDRKMPPAVQAASTFNKGMAMLGDVFVSAGESAVSGFQQKLGIEPSLPPFVPPSATPREGAAKPSASEQAQAERHRALTEVRTKVSQNPDLQIYSANEINNKVAATGLNPEELGFQRLFDGTWIGPSESIIESTFFPPATANFTNTSNYYGPGGLGAGARRANRPRGSSGPSRYYNQNSYDPVRGAINWRAAGFYL